MWDSGGQHYLDERLACALVGAFLISLVLTPTIRDVSNRRQLLDKPNERSLHSVPVPRLGGVAVVTGSFTGAAMLAELFSWQVSAIGLSALVVAVAGFIDDIRPVSPLQKYAPQLLAACMSTWALSPTLEIDLLFFQFDVEGIWAIALAVFWVTAFINAFNFMDGVDGIAGGVGLISATGLTVVSSGQAAFMLLPLAAALAGFLAWNLNPASIFMGDSGSQFIGFTLAIGALYWPSLEVNVLVVVVVFAPFLFDTGFTLIWRIWRRRNVLRAHRSHLYQRLAMSGMSHRTISNVYFGLAAYSVATAVWLSRSSGAVRVWLVSSVAVILLGFVMVVLRLERRNGIAR